MSLDLSGTCLRLGEIDIDTTSSNISIEREESESSSELDVSLLLERTRGDGETDRMVYEARRLVEEVLEDIPNLSTSDSWSEGISFDSGNSESQWGWDGEGLTTGDIVVDAGGNEVPVSLGNDGDSDYYASSEYSSYEQISSERAQVSSSVSGSSSRSESFTLDEYLERERYIGDAGVGNEYLEDVVVGNEYLEDAVVGSGYLEDVAIGNEYLEDAVIGSEYLEEVAAGNEYLEVERYADDLVVISAQGTGGQITNSTDVENSYDNEINGNGTSGGIDRDGGSSSIEGQGNVFVLQFDESIGGLTYERELEGEDIIELELAVSSSQVNERMLSPDERN